MRGNLTVVFTMKAHWFAKILGSERMSIIDGVMHSKCLLMRISFADFLTYIRICGFVGGAGKWICPRVEIEFVQAAPVLLNHR